MPDSGSQSCLFCKIVSEAIPSPRVDENAEFICIRDIRPQAPQHLLVVPRLHIARLDAAFPEDGPSQAGLIGRMFEFGVGVARRQGLLPGGFRSVINTGENGGQTVFHIHLHLLGGVALQDAFG